MDVGQGGVKLKLYVLRFIIDDELSAFWITYREVLSKDGAILHYSRFL